MELRLTLCLPRDELSVSVVRHTLRDTLRVLGISDADGADIQLAVSEACTNVLDHVTADDEYEVTCAVDHESAVIEVIDRGAGFDAESVGTGEAGSDAEGGRGLQLIRALADRVAFERRDLDGTVVRFEKQLTVAAEAPIRRLAGHPHQEVSGSQPR